jgi:hypothetical protein
MKKTVALAYPLSRVQPTVSFLESSLWFVGMCGVLWLLLVAPSK